MEKVNKSQLFNEGLEKFKYRVNYKINESAKYRPLVGMDEEFDELPLRNEAGEPEEPPKPDTSGDVPKPPSNDPQMGTPAPTPTPAFDDNANGATPPDGNTLPMDGGIPPTMAEPTPQVDDIQNEIIKHNLEAMKSIHDQLEKLNSMTLSLDDKLNSLSSEVEEVREPSNTEKLMNKTNVSYPYYFNLNDFWSGNWFNEQREKELDKGIKELPDGSFVADFDDLPQKSKIDIQNSFNDLSESNVKKRIIKEEFEYADNTPEKNGIKSEIDGAANKKTAINKINVRTNQFTKGIFRDEYWTGVKKIFEVFGQMGLDWNLVSAEYDREQPPKYKTWNIEIRYVDNLGSQKTIGGYVRAFGAGSVEYPLDAYDLVLILW